MGLWYLVYGMGVVLVDEAGTRKVLVRAMRGSLFMMMENSLLSGARNSEGSRHLLNRFCTVARMSISVS